MSRPPVEAVFFDAAGTLFRVRGSVGEVYGRVACRFGFELPAGADSWTLLGEAFGKAFREREPMLFHETAKARLPKLERAWWREVVAETFAAFGAFPRFDDFFREVYDLFGTAGPWVLEPDARKTLAKLKGRGLRLGVISNFDSRLEGLLASLGIREFFEAVTISSVCGAAKPDPAIFLHALQRLGAVAERSIHVGDDREDDCLGAESVGMKALLFDPEWRWPAAPTRIGSLAEVEAFLL